MPTYVLLSSLTDHGAKTVRANPSRIGEVDKEIEAMGIKVVAQYALLGAYDFVTIVEAPDNGTVARMSLEMGARGTVRIQTLPAIAIDDLVSHLA